MIRIAEVLEIHRVLVQSFGGADGVRDLGLLQAAIERPFSGFGDQEFYPSPEEKAAAIGQSIIQNHPFMDGNKRTGYVLMRLMLMTSGKDLLATEDEKYDFVIRIASGKMNYQEILDWLRYRMIAQ
jgi:death-on-curing protein